MTQLTLEHTVRSYSGKIGCMCGCQGEYKETPRARKLAITQLTKQGALVQDFGSVSKDGSAGCLYIESETRNRVLYLTQEGLAVARKLFKEAV